MSLNRRDAIKLGGLALAASSVSLEASSPNKNIEYKAPIPETKNPRVVVVGGGWSGLSVAKNVKILSPNADVILVESRFEFISCPLSNLWLVDKVSLEYLTHDYLQAAKENNYTFFNATATQLDKKNQILKTSNGDIKYDYLVLAPGIDYDYSRWSKGDLAFEQRLYSEYPPAFKPGSEHLSLKNKIKNFKGGNFILTVPAGNYRCLPAPYERACVIADYFKQNKIDGKVIILDENENITIKAKGFKSAFDELYSNYIEYIPAAAISSIDLDKKVVSTEFDDYEFSDASFYPRVQGAKILERFGLAKDGINKREADINPLTYEANSAKNVFISGDARPMPFSKSANTAATEGEYVAKIVASRINKKAAPKWESAVTRCFSAISINPQRSISLRVEYAYDDKAKTFSFANPQMYEDWKGNGEKDTKLQFEWADAIFKNLFSK